MILDQQVIKFIQSMTITHGFADLENPSDTSKSRQCRCFRRSNEITSWLRAGRGRELSISNLWKLWNI